LPCQKSQNLSFITVVPHTLVKVGRHMSDKYLYELPSELPSDGCSIVYTRHGIVTALEALRKDQFVSSLRGFIELAESVGYQIIPPQID
jgi:hypothetical protein